MNRKRHIWCEDCQGVAGTTGGLTFGRCPRHQRAALVNRWTITLLCAVGFYLGTYL